MSPSLLVYDGDCGLCQGAVRFILRHERDSDIGFVPRASPAGLRLRAEFQIPDALDALIWIVEGEPLQTGAEAALAVCVHLRAPWRWLRMLRILPRPCRARLYAAVARRRRRWFGSGDVCALTDRLSPARDIRAADHPALSGIFPPESACAPQV